MHPRENYPVKILLTHRYIWPDTAPYALMLRAIGAHLAAKGHEVHMLGSKPSYRRVPATPAPRREMLDGMSVRRVFALSEASRNPAARVINVLLYGWALFWGILRLRPDVVTASTFPPVAAGWIVGLAARLTGTRFVYHMMDLHPEVSQLSGGQLGRGWLGRFLMRRDQASLRRAATAVVLSNDMRNTLAARPGGLGCKVEIIQNLALDAETDLDPPADLVKHPDRVRVIFAGNLGRFQDIPLLARGVAQLFPAHPELELLFLGDGIALPELKAEWVGHPQVRFAPFLPFAQARPLIRSADIGLVSLSPGIHRVACPSKMITYLKLGVPLLALVDATSQLAQTVTNEDLGTVPVARTPEAVAAALAPLVSHPERLEMIRNQVKLYYNRNLSPDSILKSWEDLVQ